MRIERGGLVLRPWETRDVEALARHANDVEVWRNLRDRFPHPYTRAHAQAWIAHCATLAGTPTQFAIEVAGEAAGAVGFDRFEDVHRVGAEIGYWIGRRYWGRGIATAALSAATDHAFTHSDLLRLEATVYEWNPASARVLEKAGYQLEGRLRCYVVKDGRVGDGLRYARIRADWKAASG